jgi:FHS family L-fucose permease-like MFS transporter
MVAAWSYAVCVNFVPSYRDPADKIGDSKIGLTDTPTDEESSEGDPEKGVKRSETKSMPSPGGRRA